MIKLLLALFLLCPQESTEDLIKKLDSDKIEERDAAAKKLRALGPAAAGFLLQLIQSSDPELAHRANELLRNIKHDEHIKRVTRSLPLITLKCNKTRLSDVVKSIKDQTGIEVATSILGDNLVTVDLVDAPLLKALDLICAGAEERGPNWELSWYQRNNEISFGITDGAINKPTIYLDKFRLQVSGTMVTIRNDLRDAMAGVSLWIDTVNEPQFRPFIGPSLTVTSMIDEDGKALLLTSDNLNLTGKQASLATLMWRNSSEGKGSYFAGLNIPITSKKLKSIKGKINSVVELERTRLTFETLKKGSIIEFGDIKIWIDEIFADNSCGVLRVQFSGHKHKVDSLLVESQVFFTDKEGLEHKITVSTSSDQFYLYPQGEGGVITWMPVSMSFDLITDWLECEREFEITDIPLR